MELSILKELVAQITTFDLEGGVNLFSIKPTWIDTKFIAYPVSLKFINKVETTLETKTMKYYFVQQNDYVRIKSIFRLMYLTEKV
jgi:hypothetical protein